MSGSDAVGDRELDGGCCPELPTEILDSHGIPLLVRLVEPSDEAAIRDLHERCSCRDAANIAKSPDYCGNNAQNAQALGSQTCRCGRSTPLVVQAM
ncbi:MAG: hypothetical protein IPL93_11595 [Actinomycetales bacterium]|nr:hypothetical protein [Actinomycetales bacterium]